MLDMSDWNMDKCKVHYSDLIPQSIIKDYDLDSVLCTTFSLQQEQLHELLYEIGAFPLIAKEKVHIFYDGFSRDGKKSFESVISEKLLHEIVLENEGKLFAFHPKVVLMRYKKKESVETIRYVVIVSSKNISTANLWDAYALAYGDVGTDEHESGRKLAEFIGEIYKKVDKKDISKDFIIPDELRKTKFVPGDESDAREVIFYKPEEVWDEIKDKSGLTIISPFLSDEFILESKDNIKNLISTEQGYAKLKEETIKFMLDGNRAFLFNGDLHAKIYSWNENDEIRYIVGSSNATKNGCNITNDSQNIEYNTGFGSKDEIFKSIEERIKPINIEDYKVWKKDASDDVDFRRVYVEFWKNKRIECSKKDNEYIVSVDFAEFEQLKKNVLLDGFKVLCTVGEKEKDIEKNIEFRLPSPPLYFRVTIKN